MNKELFMNYMKKEFSPMDNHFTYDLVSNVVDYVTDNYEGAQRDEMFLKLIPEITEDDLQKYYLECGEVKEFEIGSMKFYYYTDSYKKYPGKDRDGYIAYGYNENGEKRAFLISNDGSLCCSWQIGAEPWRTDFFGGVR